MQNLSANIFKLVAIILCVVIGGTPAVAQQPGDLGLRIIIVRGDGAENLVQQIPADAFSIAVVDRAGRPVPGAVVTFTAPEAGPSGDFANGLHTLNTLTDDDGRAYAPQFRSNDVVGNYRIEVTAERGGERATATIRQRNIAPKKSFRKVFVVLAIAGAAAGAAVAAGGGGGGNSTPSTPQTPNTPSVPTISFGGSSVGPPN